MFAIVLVIALAAWIGAFHWHTKKKLMGHIQELERDLQCLCDVVIKMTEAQTEIQHKFSGDLEELEERIMELSVPSTDSGLPLERRHQVLALARQGVPLEDIVKRLKAPIGEAELILNLRRFRGKEGSRTAAIHGQVSPHV